MTKPYEETLVGAESHASTDTDAACSLRLVLDAVVVASALPRSAPIVLGRGIDAHVIVAHPSVSRRHATLTREGAAFVLEDLGSANGTVVRMEQLERGQRAPLALGEPFALGGAMISVFDGASHESPMRVIGDDGLTRAIGRITAGPHRTAHVVAFEGAPGPFVDIVGALLLRRDVLAVRSEREAIAVLLDRSDDDVAVLRDMLAKHFARLAISVAIAEPMSTQVAALPTALAPFLDARAPQSSLPPTDTRGVAPSMRGVYQLIDDVAASPTSVLLLGETGVGKEVLARRVHASSPRRDRAFVGLNCAAFSETLLESELFGHEKGAFTGAVATKQGLIELADGGTLFLDELGEMPLVTQAKLLRVLEERAVLRVGGLKPRAVDLRLVAATNRNLKEDVASGRFRADLLYRVNAIEVRIPPLRERLDELPMLVAHFVEHAARALARPMPVVSDEAMALFRRYPWPGNVRELRNVIERAVLLARSGTVLPQHLPEDFHAPSAPPMQQRAPTLVDTREIQLTAPPPPSAETLGGLTGELEAMEKARIVEALERCAGNQTRAAAMLGITRRVLISRLERYGIARPRR